MRVSYGAMSGLISQPCLRLFYHRPLGGGNGEKTRWGDEKATWEALTTIEASSLQFYPGMRQDFDKGTHTPLVTLHQPPPVPLCLPHSTLSSSIYMKTKQEKMLRLTESIFLPWWWSGCHRDMWLEKVRKTNSLEGITYYSVVEAFIRVVIISEQYGWLLTG